RGLGRGRRARADWSWGLQGWGRPGTEAARRGQAVALIWRATARAFRVSAAYSASAGAVPQRARHSWSKREAKAACSLSRSAMGSRARRSAATAGVAVIAPANRAVRRVWAAVASSWAG